MLHVRAAQLTTDAQVFTFDHMSHGREAFFTRCQ